MNLSKNSQKIISIATALILGVLTNNLHAAAINFDAGILSIQGVQVFEDANDSNKFYYLPQYPRLAQNDNGDFELLMLKYVGGKDGANGGIFHALIEFTLPEDTKAAVAQELKQIRPNAELVGALPLLEGGEKDAYGSFRVTSAILNSENDGIGSKLISSGPAPLYESSRAAIAAKINQEDATLLMNSLTGSTSDISVSIRGYYLAKVKGYNATISADMENVYNHKSFLSSFQSGYTRRQIRDISDEMIQDGTIKVEVFDQSEGLGIESESMSKITDLVTEKLTEIMFNTETGWSKQATPEVAVAEGQIKGRLKRGWFQKTFMNSKDTPYYSDDQFVFKRREDIRSNHFYMNLSKTTTIRLPFDSTGNLGGFYQSIEERDRTKYFRTISLADDADMQSREVYFQVDSQVAEGFKSSFNSVAVNVRKLAADGTPAFTRSLVFDHESLDKTNGLQSIQLFRLGDVEDDWMEFDYQVAWNVKDVAAPLRIPKSENKWNSSRDGIVTLIPPLARRELEVDAETSDFSTKGIAAAEVQLAAIVNGEPHFVATHLVRAADAEARENLIFYHDSSEAIAYRIVWHTRKGRNATDFAILEDSLLFLFSPEEEWLNPQDQRSAENQP